MDERSRRRAAAAASRSGLAEGGCDRLCLNRGKVPSWGEGWDGPLPPLPPAAGLQGGTRTEASHGPRGCGRRGSRRIADAGADAACGPMPAAWPRRDRCPCAHESVRKVALTR
eukprot:359517-Chlamydomonas_euryale.AAC.2